MVDLYELRRFHSHTKNGMPLSEIVKLSSATIIRSMPILVVSTKLYAFIEQICMQIDEKGKKTKFFENRIYDYLN